MEPGYERFDRNSDQYGAGTALMVVQPGIAWIGLIGSLLVVFVFTTATWWNQSFTGQKFALAYTAPLTVLLLWIVRKLWTKTMHNSDHRRGWVNISEEPGPLRRTLRHLDCSIADGNRVRDDLERRFPIIGSLRRRLRHEHGVDGVIGEQPPSGEVPLVISQQNHTPPDDAANGGFRSSLRDMEESFDRSDRGTSQDHSALHISRDHSGLPTRSDDATRETLQPERHPAA
jgi:hypothetical protein